MSSYGLHPAFMITENDVYTKGSPEKFLGGAFVLYGSIWYIK